MKSKKRQAYRCSSCQARFTQWQGQCPRCQAWGTLAPEEEPRATGQRQTGREPASPVVLSEVPETDSRSLSTGSQAVDSLLGDGLVPGSTILLAGEPGVGKSTFLLQLVGGFVAAQGQAMYVSGEESLSQLKRRADRLGLSTAKLTALNAASTEDVLEQLNREPLPQLVVVDSVQTLIDPDMDGIPGSIGQVRSVASRLVEAVKRTRSALIIVGHVTKEGHIAGPKILEHMVDTVLSMEGDKQHFYRILRAVKNRFGPTSAIVLLEMVDKGLRVVRDPSTFFLQARDPSLSGTAVVMALEGQRPFAVEVQALVSQSFQSQPRRTALGFDTNRLHLLLAIMEKKLKLHLGQMDVYAKIGGGLRLEEPSLDLGVVAAVMSSFFDQPLPERAIFWGEVDLSGQVRPVAGEDLRVSQAMELGYGPVVCPRSRSGANVPAEARRRIERVGALDQLQETVLAGRSAPDRR